MRIWVGCMTATCERRDEIASASFHPDARSTPRPSKDSAHFWLFMRTRVDSEQPRKSPAPYRQGQDLVARTAGCDLRDGQAELTLRLRRANPCSGQDFAPADYWDHTRLCLPPARSEAMRRRPSQLRDSFLGRRRQPEPTQPRCPSYLRRSITSRQILTKWRGLPTLRLLKWQLQRRFPRQCEM